MIVNIKKIDPSLTIDKELTVASVYSIELELPASIGKVHGYNAAFLPNTKRDAVTGASTPLLIGDIAFIVMDNPSKSMFGYNEEDDRVSYYKLDGVSANVSTGRVALTGPVCLLEDSIVPLVSLVNGELPSKITVFNHTASVTKVNVFVGLK